jgi:hypothetical protein
MEVERVVSSVGSDNALARERKEEHRGSAARRRHDPVGEASVSRRAKAEFVGQ